MHENLETAVEATQVVHFLKTEVQLKAVWQKILCQRIIDEAAKERNLTITPNEIQVEAEQFRRQRRLENASDTIAWLTDQMISAEDWEAGIYERLLAKKLAEHLFTEEVPKVFAQNRLDFEQVLLYQIVVPYKQVAQELFYQIEEQEISFFEAAHLYDIDEQRRYCCGYEGTVSRWSFDPDIAAAIFSAPVGEVVGPLKTDLGYHLFLVQEFIQAELTPERRQEIIDQLLRDWLLSELNYVLHNQ